MGVANGLTLGYALGEQGGVAQGVFSCNVQDCIGVGVGVGVQVGVPWAREGGIVLSAKSTNRKQPSVARQQSPALLRNRRRRRRLDGESSEVLRF